MDDWQERVIRLEGKQEATDKAMEHIGNSLLELTKEIKALTAIMERGKGAFAASMAIASVIGATALAGLQFVLKYVGKQ